MSGLGVGASVALWHADAPPPVVASSPAASSATAAHVLVSHDLPEYNPVRPLLNAYQARQDTLAPSGGFTLRTEDTLATAEPDAGTASDAASKASGESATRSARADESAESELEQPLKMPEPLNLRVPEVAESEEITKELADRNERRPSADDNADAESFEPRGLALETSKVHSTPKVTSYSLFNPEYGLRGFMKQGWVNSSLGFQGGLGFNDGRRIQTEDDGLRDDIAVGMGVILAF